jgi:hypothetical protein
MTIAAVAVCLFGVNTAAFAGSASPSIASNWNAGAYPVPALISNPFRITITNITPSSPAPGANVVISYKVELLTKIPCDSRENTMGFLLQSQQGQPLGYPVASSAGKPELGAPVTGTVRFTAPAMGSYTLFLAFGGDYNAANGQPCVNKPTPPWSSLGSTLTLGSGPFNVGFAQQSLSVGRPGGTLSISGGALGHVTSVQTNPFRITITDITPTNITSGANVALSYKVELLAKIACDAKSTSVSVELVDPNARTPSGWVPVSLSTNTNRPELGAPVTGTLNFTAPKTGSYTLLISFSGDYYGDPYSLNWCVNPVNITGIQNPLGFSLPNVWLMGGPLAIAHQSFPVGMAGGAFVPQVIVSPAPPPHPPH